jgi:hypothetical protein
MDRIIYTFGQSKTNENSQAEKHGVLELSVRSGKTMKPEQAGVRAIRSFDSALIFEGRTNETGRLRISLPVCAHKTTENYSVTVNYNGFPTKTLNVPIAAGQTVSRTVEIG